jgi:hypothetical protein
MVDLYKNIIFDKDNIMMMNIKDILNTGETQSVEFKKSMSQMKEGCKSLCGMLNTAEGSGMMIFGISPENKIVGLQGNLDSAQRSLTQHIKDKFDPLINISLKLENYEDKFILILSAKRPREIRYYEYDGRAFIKEGSTKRLLTIQENEVLNTHNYSRINILDIKEKNLEKILFDILKQKNNFIETHFLKNIFDHIFDSIKEKEEFVDEAFTPYLKKMFTIWKISNDYEAFDFAEKLVSFIHKLYLDIFKDIDFNKQQGEHDVFWVQSRIIFIIYCMGAYSILIDKPNFAKLLLNRTNPFLKDNPRYSFAENLSWLFYTLHKLNEKRWLIKNSICHTILDFLDKNKIVFDEFNTIENLSDRLCQFDYFQCINEIISKVILGKEKYYDTVCFPSFGNSYMRRTEPFIVEIINTYEEGKWIPKVSKPQLVLAIKTLKDYVKKYFDNFWGPWGNGEFSSKFIKEFLTE